MSKIKIEEVRKDLEENGWELISNKYENLQSELSMKCPEGHNVYLPYGKWRKTHKCPICEKNPLIEIGHKIVPKNKDTIRILAIDDATRVSGWAIFDGEKLIQYGKIELTHASSIERINAMKLWVLNMVNMWNPDIVAIEDIQLQKFERNGGENSEGVMTFKILAQLQGVLLDFFYENGIKSEIVHVSVWRKFCDIKGKSRSDKKKSAQLKIKDWYDISVTQDEADAICIGRYIANKKQKTQILEWN